MVRPSEESADAASVDAFDDALLETREGPDVANAVPRIRAPGRFTLALVTLEKTRHEEFLGERRQTRPAGLAVVDDLFRVVGIDHFDHRARRRGVINDRPVVF